MNHLLQESFVLTAVGMSFVFLFLCLLVLAMTAMSKMVARFEQNNDNIEKSTDPYRYMNEEEHKIHPNTLKAIELAIKSHQKIS